MPNHMWSLHAPHLPHVHLHNPFHPGRLTIGLALMTIVQIIFGGYSYLTSRALKSCTVKPVIFAFVRDLGGAIILITLAYALHRRKLAKARKHADASGAPAAVPTRFWIARQDLGTFALAGLLGVYGAQCLSAATIGVTSGLFFSLFTPLTPVLTMIWCLLLKQEHFSVHSKLSWIKLFGILVAVGGGIGIAVSSASGSAMFSTAKSLGLGFFLLCLQLLSASSYGVVQKPLLSRYSPVTVAGWTYVLGTCLIALGIIDDTNAKPEDWAFSPLAGWAVAYAIVFSSAIAYALIAVVIRICNPVIVTATYPVQAIVTTLLTWGIDGVVPPAGTIASAVIIAGGLVVMVLAKHKEELESHARRGSFSGAATAGVIPQAATVGTGLTPGSSPSPSSSPDAAVDAQQHAKLAAEPCAPCSEVGCEIAVSGPSTTGEVVRLVAVSGGAAQEQQ